MSLTTKLLMVSVATAAGAMIGLFFAKRLKARSEYFDALVHLTEQLLSEVRFRRTKVKEILSGVLARGETPLRAHLTEYLAAPNPKCLQLSRGRLKPAELAEVQSFFSSFGAVDCDTQEGELNAARERFLLYFQSAEHARATYASMCIKLGFFAGLAGGILLL